MSELVLPLYDRIRRVLLEAQSTVSRAVNMAMVHAYFEIGRLIVDDEQHGRARAEYGEETLKVTTQAHKTVSCDFAISALLDPERTMGQTGNLTAEYAEGRGGRING